MRKFALVLATIGTLAPLTAYAENPVQIPPPVTQAKAQGDTEVAVLAGGCFWGIQAVYQHVKGVKNAVSGYAGGNAMSARYQIVSSGTTGHAEAVQVTFNPRVVSYGQILQVYFSVAHNPTELNFQGPDHGPQYRSTIFAANAEQKAIAESYIAQLGKAKLFSGPIVTTIETGKTFYPAEDYHQDFLIAHPTYPYIVINDKPKLANFQRLLPSIYRDAPVTVSGRSASR